MTQEACIEVVTDGTPDRVLAANLLMVPISELEDAKKAYAETKQCLCHTKRRFVEDEHCWLYDFRKCAVCGRSLGTV